MLTFQNIALTILMGFSLLNFVGLLWVGYVNGLNWRLLQNVPTTEFIHGWISTISRSLKEIVEGQRLSAVLSLSPASLKISPERFEANKGQLRKGLLRALKDSELKGYSEPSTRAFCILNASGWENFVEGDTRLAAQRALARLIVNGDEEGLRALCEELVDKL